MQLLYHDPSLGRPVNFLLKRLEILKEESPGLSRPPDIDRYLSSFCNWQRTKNPVGDREPQHWDHALILTGLDLYVRGKHGKISSQVVGTFENLKITQLSCFNLIIYFRTSARRWDVHRYK